MYRFVSLSIVAMMGVSACSGGGSNVARFEAACLIEIETDPAPGMTEAQSIKMCECVAPGLESRMGSAEFLRVAEALEGIAESPQQDFDDFEAYLPRSSDDYKQFEAAFEETIDVCLAELNLPLP